MADERAVTRRDVSAVIAHEDFKQKIREALPKAMEQGTDRFTRCVLTALQVNPDIIEGDPSTLYTAVLKAANDGLNLDGKEAALVIFNTNVARKNEPPKWIKKVQYMPMVGGIIKRLGEVGFSVDSQVVHEMDTFHYRLGDDAMIEHSPPALGQPRGKMIGAYVIIKRKSDNEVYREVMDEAQIEAVRSQSRNQDSLMWTKFASEGWRKTVTRRCAKRIPFVDERLNSILEADNEGFEFDEDVPVPPVKAAAAPAPPPARDKDPTVVSTQQPKKANAMEKLKATPAAKAPPAPAPPPPPPPPPEPDLEPDPEEGEDPPPDSYSDEGDVF